MSPSQRRAEIVKLLAEIDQDIREAESIASDRSLPWRERREAKLDLDFFRVSAERVEGLLERVG